jgi:hypothetical protein
MRLFTPLHDLHLPHDESTLAEGLLSIREHLLSFVMVKMESPVSNSKRPRSSGTDVAVEPPIKRTKFKPSELITKENTLASLPAE